MMTSGTNMAVGMLSTVWCWGLPNVRARDLENRALCSMTSNLQGNASPTPTLSTLQPTVCAQRRVEGMGVNILLEKPGQTQVLSVS